MTTSPIRRNEPISYRLRSGAKRFAAICLCLALAAVPAIAVPIVKDPDGFEGIPWGAALSQTEYFVKNEDAGRLQTYEPAKEAAVLGTTRVDSLRFTTYEGKFGRVTVRYSGKDTHERILSYLQSTYGPLDRTPGQIAVGPVKVHAWHGFNTEVPPAL